MRLLVTGHNGYIGSVMTPALRDAGHEPVGLDAGFFRECTLGRDAETTQPAKWKDLRDISADDLIGIDAVIHLAALSNDPIGNLNATWTTEINLEGSVRLAALAKSAGVERFLFSSSCIMYGLADGGFVDETAPLRPQTEYARSKVEAERAIVAMADDTFSPALLRNGTVYGLSPHMRFDTVLNSLVGSAVATGRVIVRSDGTPWRPVVHVADVARAFIAVLEAPREVVHAQAFNVGADWLNRQVIDLAHAAISAIPGARLEVVDDPDADRRTYRTDFGKFASSFPEFRFQWDPDSGARQLAGQLRLAGVDAATFGDPRFTRLRWLSHLLDTRRLDSSLRWREAPVGLVS